VKGQILDVVTGVVRPKAMNISEKGNRGHGREIVDMQLLSCPAVIQASLQYLVLNRKHVRCFMNPGLKYIDSTTRE